MKRIIVIILLVIFNSAFINSGDIGNVIEGMKYGNAGQVAVYVDKSAEIAFSDGEAVICDKTQALKQLQSFFATHAVKTFEVIHKGNNARAEFCIGNLVTRNGNFRTTIYMKKIENRMILQELKFEK